MLYEGSKIPEAASNLLRGVVQPRYQTAAEHRICCGFRGFEKDTSTRDVRRLKIRQASPGEIAYGINPR